jgi:uncharacterized protein YhaN
MGDQTSGCGTGCGLLLGLFGLALALAYWPFALAALVLGVAGWLGWQILEQQGHQQLRGLVQAADRRFRHDPCQLQGRFGLIESIALGDPMPSSEIRVHCRLIAPSSVEEGLAQQARPASGLGAEDVHLRLVPPVDRLRLRAASGVATMLSSAGITPLDPLSVEAKAVKAAMESIRERDWSHQALARLDGLNRSLLDTLAKARGNELLEASIPRLQQAQAAFAAEEQRLRQARDSADSMLAKLHDFLSVPEAIRPILQFDLDQLFDLQRLVDLEQSFAEVVQLNDAFRELS